MTARQDTDEAAPRAPLTFRSTPTPIRPVALLLAAFLVALTQALASHADAYVYWTNPGAGTIGRANLDGTGVDNGFIMGAGTPSLISGPGVAVNSTHIYWVVSSDAIARANLNGSGVDKSFIADVYTGPGRLEGVAVDDAHVYWVSQFSDDLLNPRTGAIGRANADGTGIDEDFITGVSYPTGVVAVEGSHLYWTSISEFTVVEWPDRIGRANLDGSGVDENFITGGFGRHSPGLAVGESHIWWTSEFSIERAKLDGTGTEFVIGGLAGDSGQDFLPCGGIAVDDTHVYWSGGYSPDSKERIGRAKLDGTRVNNDFITGIDPDCGDVAVDGLGPPPSNDFRITGVKKNKRKGTARLTVKVPGQGELELAKTTKMKADDETVGTAGRESLRVKPKGKAKKKLNRRGKAKVKAKVTYTPDGGEPNTQTKRVRLIKR